MPEACSERAPGTADVDAKLRHGRLRAAGFCGVVENRAGRTELMPNESEACVESGSGHGIDARAGFFASINHGKKRGCYFFSGSGNSSSSMSFMVIRGHTVPRATPRIACSTLSCLRQS